jgi:flagellar protein FlaG
MSTVHNISIENGTHSTSLSDSGSSSKATNLARRIESISDSTAAVAKSLNEQKLHASAAIDEVRHKLEEAIDTIHSTSRLSDTNLSFVVDQISDRVLVSVVDKNTGESVRQVPAEAILRVAHNLEALKGVLFDDIY